MAGRIAYYGNIVTNGLVLNLDAGKKDSYPGSGTTWRDISVVGTTGSLFNGTLFSPNNYGSMVFDGVDDFVGVSGSITLTQATFLAWIKADGTQNAGDGLVFSRYGTGGGTTGMNVALNGTTLGYHWNDVANTYSWNSGLTIPTGGTWCMCVISISPTSAVAYLGTTSGISTATNSVSHSATTLASLSIGKDNESGRWFKGNIATAQIYNRPLSSTEVLQNYNAIKGRYGL